MKVRRTRLEELAGQGVREARVSLRCVDQLDEYLSATQLGITLVSLALGWVGESAFASLFLLGFPSAFEAGGAAHHLIASAIAFLFITLLHVVLGELVPKSMAIQKAEKITLLVSKPLSLFYRGGKPLIHAFTALANIILRRIGYSMFEEPPLTENELKLVMKESREDGVISESEALIITRAFEFSDKRAGDIMVHSDKIDMILLESRSNEAFKACSRSPIFASSSVRQDELLKNFQSQGSHLAIVRDPATSIPDFRGTRVAPRRGREPEKTRSISGRPVDPRSKLQSCSAPWSEPRTRAARRGCAPFADSHLADRAAARSTQKRAYVPQ